MNFFLPKINRFGWPLGILLILIAWSIVCFSLSLPFQGWFGLLLAFICCGGFFASAQPLSAMQLLLPLLAAAGLIALTGAIQPADYFLIQVSSLPWVALILFGALLLYAGFSHLLRKNYVHVLFWSLFGLALMVLLACQLNRNTLPYFIGLAICVLLYYARQNLAAMRSNGSISHLVGNRETVTLTLVLLAALFFFIFILLKNAWVSDDAYITFRTADNVLHGLGLRWNPIERVQTYTHPLWLFLVTAAAWITKEFFHTSMALGLFFTLLTMLVIIKSTAPRILTPLGLIIILSFSKAFVDYSTSGLENALLYFLMALFFFRWHEGPKTSKTLLQLTLVAALGALTRPDAILLFIPPVADYWLSLPNKKKLRSLGPVCLGLAPLLVWEFFSLWYYGFPFPNTAYAKLNTGLGWAVTASNGFFYYVNSILMDPVTLITISLGISLPWIQRNRSLYSWSISLAVYLVYIVTIGGDFMSGRFFALPFLTAALILGSSRVLTRKAIPWMVGCLFLLGLLSPENPWNSRDVYSNTSFDAHQIADERGYYYHILGLSNNSKYQDQLRHRPFAYLPKESPHAFEAPVFEHFNMGILGFTSGPAKHIIDLLGLTDPLLARLPATRSGWRIGHYRRLVPLGYMDSVMDHSNRVVDPDLARFYDKIKLITQGNLWSVKRLLTILNMNLGRYDALINRTYYQARVPDSKRPRYLCPGLSPQAYRPWVDYGVHLALHGRWDQAAEAWQKASKLDPMRYEADANLGIYYERKGQISEALPHYQRAAEFFGAPWSAVYNQLRSSLANPGAYPDLTPSQTTVSQFRKPVYLLLTDDYSREIHRGNQIIEQTGLWDQGKEHFLRALALAPGRPEAWANLGIVYEEEGNYSKALEAYARAGRKLGRPWLQFYNQVRCKQRAKP